MAFVSVTRLRLRSVRFLPAFAWLTFHAVRQVRQAQGFRGGSLLPDRRWTFWTMTMWESEARMRDFMLSGDHKTAMPRLLNWGDEASVVHWEQADEAPPSWVAADARMRAEGRPSKVAHPSADHATMRFAAPRLTGAAPLRPATA